MELILRMLTIPTVVAASIVVLGLIYSHVTGRALFVFYPNGKESDDRSEGDEVLDFVTLDSIQGDWRMVSVGRNGNFAPKEVVEKGNLVMSITGNRFSINNAGGSGLIKLRNNLLPTHMDQLGDDGDVHRCLVRFLNSELEICQAEAGKKRPQHFAPDRFDGASLTRFTRIASPAHRQA